MYYTWYSSDVTEAEAAKVFLDNFAYVLAVLVFSTAAFVWSVTPENSA